MLSSLVATTATPMDNIQTALSTAIYHFTDLLVGHTLYRATSDNNPKESFF